MGQGFLFLGSHLLIKMMFSMLSSELFWKRGEYQVIWPTEEETAAISEWRLWTGGRKAVCVPPCGRAVPPSQGSQSEGNRYVPLQIARRKNRVPGQLAGPEFLVWWGSLEGGGFSLALHWRLQKGPVCLMRGGLVLQGRTPAVGWPWGRKLGGCGDPEQSRHFRPPRSCSPSLVLPRNKLLGASYLLLRDSVTQKKGAK